MADSHYIKAFKVRMLALLKDAVHTSKMEEELR